MWAPRCLKSSNCCIIKVHKSSKHFSKKKKKNYSYQLVRLPIQLDLMHFITRLPLKRNASLFHLRYDLMNIYSIYPTRWIPMSIVKYPSNDYTFSSNNCWHMACHCTLLTWQPQLSVLNPTSISAWLGTMFFFFVNKTRKYAS